MFKSLQDFFQKKVIESQDSDKRKTELAAATLMFEVIRADGEIEERELMHMEEILRKKFHLSDSDLSTLIELAQKTSDDSISLQGYTRHLCESWKNAERMKLLEHLWVISLADQKIDPHERQIVRKVASLLYLTERQIMQSRENAKKTLGQ